LIADSLTERYEALAHSGRVASRSEIARDVQLMFEGNFRQWIGEPELAGDTRD
jgi:hypothetical protein